ncbi:MOSC domain-containing protein [Roseomonas fluvialis]|uniref:Molybdenum cofactor biosynthesis protein n=1 Tax=Roseomonas fluvialis TaxID=1750527 RepID=A0ABN6P0K7_9PROT|nr:MOSC domain-containing protein [Roseomonas fluvialis]BDG72104.1 molybdenum cofactor biosynthesis protein [Roseomonas fluvialis]
MSHDFTGVLLAIHVATEASAPMVELDAARLVEGLGIEGDRYATQRGTYSGRPLAGDNPFANRQVTLIEMETLDALQRDHGIDLAPHETRRNLTTAGVPLNHLVGREFRVGDVVLVGGRLNVPCQYLEDLLGKPVFKPLIHRSGLNCRIVKGGTIRPGDAIRPL